MTYDDELADRIRAVLSTESGVSEKRMFGGLAFLVDGHMAAAANRAGQLMVRVDPATSAELTERDGVGLMVMRGREMPGWLDIEQRAVDSEAELHRWVGLGVAYCRSLPPK